MEEVEKSEEILFTISTGQAYIYDSKSGLEERGEDFTIYCSKIHEYRKKLEESGRKIPNWLNNLEQNINQNFMDRNKSGSGY